MKPESLIHIGTSGWHYDHWQGPFYPKGLAGEEMLGFYAERFRAVEINNSFYQLPSAETLAAWRGSVPEGFVFAVKASRYITHMKKLKDPAEPVGNFLERIGALGERLGPVLFQLPPKWRCNTERLRRFLEQLPGRFRYTFEFRDASWFRKEVLDLLREANAAFCIYQLAGVLSPREVTADFVYVRLHGPGAAYQGCYDVGTLSGWAGAVTAWARQGREIYCFFDNDQRGYAARNAMKLQDLLTKGG